MLRNLLASHSLVRLKFMVEQWCGGWACAPSHHKQNQFQSPTQKACKCRRPLNKTDFSVTLELQRKPWNTKVVIVHCSLSQDQIISSITKTSDPYSCTHFMFSNLYHLWEPPAFICSSCSQSITSVLVHPVLSGNCKTTGKNLRKPFRSTYLEQSVPKSEQFAQGLPNQILKNFWDGECTAFLGSLSHCWGVLMREMLFLYPAWTSLCLMLSLCITVKGLALSALWFCVSQFLPHNFRKAVLRCPQSQLLSRVNQPRPLGLLRQLLCCSPSLPSAPWRAELYAQCQRPWSPSPEEHRVDGSHLPPIKEVQQ